MSCVNGTNNVLFLCNIFQQKTKYNILFSNFRDWRVKKNLKVKDSFFICYAQMVLWLLMSNLWLVPGTNVDCIYKASIFIDYFVFVILWRYTDNDFLYVILHLGTNSVGRGAAPGQIVEDARSLVSRMLHLLPGVRIIVSGILPRAESRFNVVDPRIHPNEMNLTAVSTNRKMADWIARVDSVSYLGHPGFADKRGIRRDLLSRDGLHLSPAGVRMQSLYSRRDWEPIYSKYTENA